MFLNAKFIGNEYSMQFAFTWSRYVFRNSMFVKKNGLNRTKFGCFCVKHLNLTLSFGKKLGARGEFMHDICLAVWWLVTQSKTRAPLLCTFQAADMSTHIYKNLLNKRYWNYDALQHGTSVYAVDRSVRKP